MTQLALGDRRPDTAWFSPCSVYRYELTREFGGDRTLAICGLNPSTATAETNDPTIRREIDYAKRWDCGRLQKVNAYGFRATDPKVMQKADRDGVDIIGPENLAAIRGAIVEVMRTDGIFLVAWGSNIAIPWQAVLTDLILETGVAPMCLGINRNGTPVHPLYQPADRQPIPWLLPV